MNSYEEIKNIIQNISNEKPIIIAGHENADLDSIGSSLALAFLLEKNKKKDISILLSEKDLYKIAWFDNKRLISSNIKKNNYVFIMVDLNRKGRLGEFENYFDRADLTINIDHHEKNKNESTYTISDPDISSTCEMIFNLIKQFNCPLDKDIATMLYAGVLTDTAGFSIRMTPNTFNILSELLTYGIDYEYITKKSYLERTQLEISALSEMISNIKFDIFHYIIIDKKNPIFKDLEYSQLFKKMFPILRNIKEVKVLGIFLIDNENVYGEFKSNVDIDVSELARVFGGGGHRRSAGFTSILDINNILDISKKYIKASLSKIETRRDAIKCKNT